MFFSKKIVDRYLELKLQVPDCVLLMQVGAFMQVMNEDANTVSELTGLALQIAGDPAAPVIMGGFPSSGLDRYVGILARAGRSLAIAPQDATKQRSIREIVRVSVIAPPVLSLPVEGAR